MPWRKTLCLASAPRAPATVVPVLLAHAVAEDDFVLGDLGMVNRHEVANVWPGTTPFGTFPYIAPEVFTYGQFVHGADVWALGLSVLECVRPGGHPLCVPGVPPTPARVQALIADGAVESALNEPCVSLPMGDVLKVRFVPAPYTGKCESETLDSALWLPRCSHRNAVCAPAACEHHVLPCACPASLLLRSVLAQYPHSFPC